MIWVTNDRPNMNGWSCRCGVGKPDQAERDLKSALSSERERNPPMRERAGGRGRLTAGLPADRSNDGRPVARCKWPAQYVCRQRNWAGNCCMMPVLSMSAMSRMWPM